MILFLYFTKLVIALQLPIMDDDQNLDDSIDSVILGGVLLQEQGGFPETGDDDGGGEPSPRYEEECESTIHFGKIRFEWTIKVWKR